MTNTYVEIEPREVTAVQFLIPKDFPHVKRGYLNSQNGTGVLVVSDAVPRSIHCRGCFMIETGMGRVEVEIGDWIITKPSGHVKVMSPKKFEKKYRLKD